MCVTLQGPDEYFYSRPEVRANVTAVQQFLNWELNRNCAPLQVCCTLRGKLGCATLMMTYYFFIFFFPAAAL